MRGFQRACAGLCLLLGSFGYASIVTARAWAQEPKGAAPRQDARKMPGESSGRGSASSETGTMRGLLTVRRSGDRVRYEIPASLLGKEMLWYTELAAVPADVEVNDFMVASRVVHWERRGSRILLRDLSLSKRPDDSHTRPLGSAGGRDEIAPVRLAVDQASLAPIIMAFPIQKGGRKGSVVIDVTELLTADSPEFSPRKLLEGAGLALAGVDARRSFLEEVHAYPTGIRARSLLTYTLQRNALDLLAAASVSVAVHHNLMLLPEQPMRVRYADPRVGYFTVAYTAYGGREERVVHRRLIQRFRLEKRDPAAALSDPVRPIRYFISREVPNRWRPYIKKGVEDWNVAFRAAGFTNAVVCRDAPSPQEDPLWSPDDPRHSVIRWSAQAQANAMGPVVHDPRTGEILAAKVVLLADLLRIAQFWYFAQCSGVDARARKFPLPEELTGELLRAIVSHEVGHTLGLRHNHRASSAFTVKQLRDPSFTERYGTVASIMSYGRYNYVTQPGDGVKRLLPKIGPYDLFAITWGYRPIPGSESPRDERKTLDQWAARQVTEPWLRFGGEAPEAIFDPSVKTEAIGSDSIEATALGLKNLERAIHYLGPATAGPGTEEDLRPEVYGEILYQRRMWLWSVMKLVGGAVALRKPGPRSEATLVHVPRAQQREAVSFLLRHAFTAQAALQRSLGLPSLSRSRARDPVKEQQEQLLKALLLPARYRLLSEAEGRNPLQAYPLTQFLQDVQNGLWAELGAPQPRIDYYRREIQRLYLLRLCEQLASASGGKGDGEDGAQDVAAFEVLDDEATEETLLGQTEETDFPAVARPVLQALRERISAAIRRTKDPLTLAHLRARQRELATILQGE
jgi:hypothetical protein